MKPGKVRPIAICVFHNDGRILVFEGYDETKQQIFYRPLGGKIEFGEYSQDTVAREIKEELGQKVKNLRYLGVIENVFIYQGEKGHEIVVVYDGEFIDPALYNQAVISGADDGGLEYWAYWKSIAEFGNTIASEPDISLPPLYPTGLIELLREKL